MHTSIPVTAILAVRNGGYYIDRLFEHLRINGIKVIVIDNESNDDTKTRIQENQDIVIDYSVLKYNGTFNLTEQLEVKKRVIDTIDEGWVIHLDIDEFMCSDIEGESLAEAIIRIDQLGYTAINFDEFVFLPVRMFGDFHSGNYPDMRYYYFFEPKKIRLQRAFKVGTGATPSIDGHFLEGETKMYPENMILRHYMFQNKRDVQEKYKTRTYASEDISNDFHGNRLIVQNRNIKLPQRKRLKKTYTGQWSLDTSDPHKTHFWEWQD